jgi:glyoxylase-like metal-dependent hydrolase (beta-lactamase superfamily II)
MRAGVAVLALGVVACSGEPPGEDVVDAPVGPSDDGLVAQPDAPSGLSPGTLAVSWMHGAPNCNQSTDPELQVHAYNPTTYIIRQDKCRTFEAPFVYVLIGGTSALLLDSGDLTSTTLRTTVRGLIGSRPLLVAHSHSHGDHVRGDATFAGQPATTVVGTTRAAVQAAFGITSWPDTVGQHDLGGRVLDVLAIPGHEQAHIALYDRQTGLLLTGDSLYPGLLFVNDWTAYRASIARLRDFAAARPIAHVLGTHVEMSATPGVVYPYGTTYQPNEHVLQLALAQLVELDAALAALGPTPPAQPQVHDDFIIDPP